MATRDFGGGMQGVLEVATTALLTAVEGRDGRPLLCQGTASLFDALAAAHARYDARTSRSWLCMWRIERPGVASVVTLEQPERTFPEQARSPSAGRDWWLRSAARIATFDWLAQPHVAELPLSVETSRPSVLVLARAEPFTEQEGERLGAVRRHLDVLDRVLDRLSHQVPTQVPAQVPAQPPVPALDRPAARRGDSTADLLTSREREVLVMLSEGLLARSIAQKLAVSERTVHKHLGNLYRKLDAHDRLLAVRRAEHLGLLPAQSASPRW